MLTDDAILAPWSMSNQQRAIFEKMSFFISNIGLHLMLGSVSSETVFWGILRCKHSGVFGYLVEEENFEEERYAWKEFS